VRRYPHPRASPLRIDEINENFSQIHPEIQHDIRGFVVIQVGQLQIQTETIAINVMRYLNENVAVNLRTRPVNVTDISNEQMMHNDQIRATARYQSVQQLWDYNRLTKRFPSMILICTKSIFLDHVSSADACF